MDKNFARPRPITRCYSASCSSFIALQRWTSSHCRSTHLQFVTPEGALTTTPQSATTSESATECRSTHRLSHIIAMHSRMRITSNFLVSSRYLTCMAFAVSRHAITSPDTWFMLLRPRLSCEFFHE